MYYKFEGDSMENIVRNDKRQKLNRKITGIIHKDRIWEQWYDQKIFDFKLPKMSQKDYLFKCIGDDLQRIMVNNRGLKTYTVQEFYDMVIKYEKAFSAMNLNKGDVICTIGLTTPEMYAIKYSATSLGLITCNLNVFDVGVSDNGKNRLYNQISNVNPKMIFTLDILEEKICNVINNENFSNIVKVSMPLTKSTPIYNPERIVMNLKMLKDYLSGKKINYKIKLNDFLSLGEQIKQENINEIYEEKLPCNISFTSGTTGINKAVLLSHDANNALAFQQQVGNFGFEKNTKHLALVPPFLAFWDADIVHAALVQGAENIIELFLDYKKIPEYFKKYDINLGIWSQYLWSSLETLSEKDLRRVKENLKLAIVGGERCELNAAEKFYNKTGILQTTGFGASEVNTTFSFAHPYCNKIGTAGIPMPYNNVKITDSSLKDVSYGVNGKLFITGPTLMNGYYHRDDLTSRVMYTDEDGIKWYYTGDYAVVDSDGCLTILDRYSEPIEINTGSKKEIINMLDIVEKVKKDRNIKNCKMTFNDNKLILHLSLDDFNDLTNEEKIESILNTIKHNLSSKYYPDIINVLDELPRTQVGKVDYKTLQAIGSELSKNINENVKLKIIKSTSKLQKRK